MPLGLPDRDAPLGCSTVRHAHRTRTVIVLDSGAQGTAVPNVKPDCVVKARDGSQAVHT
jgi:hypothetical protein